MIWLFNVLHNLGETHSVSSTVVTPLSGGTPTDPSRPLEITGFDTDLTPSSLLKHLVDGNINNQYLRIFMSLLERWNIIHKYAINK